MSEKTGLKSIIPSWKEIGFMVVRGFGLFLSVSGMAGIALILGPLDLILQDMEFTLLGGSKPPAFFACLGLAVVGGAVDFFANLGLKGLEKQQSLAFANLKGLASCNPPATRFRRSSSVGQATRPAMNTTLKEPALTVRAV